MKNSRKKPRFHRVFFFSINFLEKVSFYKNLHLFLENIDSYYFYFLLLLLQVLSLKHLKAISHCSDQ